LVISSIDSFGQKKSQNSKVVLISIDGAADWILDDLLDRNLLQENGAFSTIRRKCTYAERIILIAVNRFLIDIGLFLNGVVGIIFGVS
jgi:hypothetical protein